MACGETYRYLLRTADDKTPEDPWSFFPGVLDYDDWYDVAQSVGRLVLRSWTFLQTVEKEMADAAAPAVEEPYPKRAQLVFLHNQFVEALNELSHPLWEMAQPWELTWEPVTRKAIKVGEDGTCVLEEIDAALAYYKETPLPDSTRRPDAEESSGGLVTAALLLGAGYWGYRRWKSRR